MFQRTHSRMLSGYPPKKIYNSIACSILLFFFSSCFSVKQYSPGIPFVYKTTVAVEGNLGKSDRSDMQDQLNKQMDDSLNVRIRKKFFFKKTLVQPAKFDSANVQKTILFMENY